MANDIGVNTKIIHQNLKKMSEKIIVEAEALKASFSKEHGENDGVNKVFRLIHTRAKKVSINVDG